MNDIPKELLTALRNARKKYGVTAFDAAIKGLSDGSLTLAPARRGRPGLPEWQRLIHDWVQVRARINLGMNPEDAAQHAAINSVHLHVVEVGAGPGGTTAVTKPTMGSAKTILSNYKKAEKLRANDPDYADVLNGNLSAWAPFIIISQL